MKQISIFIMILLHSPIFGQCDADRHNMTLADMWVSCETTISPNISRGRSHWIMYDLGTTYQLGKSTIWNLNSWMHQDKAMDRYSIDISLDGQNWSEASEGNLAQAPLSGFYEGDEGPDLSDFVARYILITGSTNHGDAEGCVGISEFKVEATPVTTATKDLATEGMAITAAPNPFGAETVIDLSNIASGRYNYHIYSAEGRIIGQGSKNISGSGDRWTLNTSAWISGLYFLHLQNESGYVHIKLIKS